MYNKADETSRGERTACTFRLPASNAISVALVGSFNNWSTTANLMQRRDGHWETKVPLPPGRHTYGFFALEREEESRQVLRGSVIGMGSVIDVKPTPEDSPQDSVGNPQTECLTFARFAD